MEVTQEYEARDWGGHTAAWSSVQQQCPSGPAGTAGGAYSYQQSPQHAQQAAREGSICSTALLPPPLPPQRQLNTAGAPLPQHAQQAMLQRNAAQQQQAQHAQVLQPLLTLQQLQQEQEQYMRPLSQHTQQQQQAQQAQRHPIAQQRPPSAQQAQQAQQAAGPHGFHVEKLAHVLLRNPGFAGQLADTMASWIMENGWAESPLAHRTSSTGPAAAGAAAAAAGAAGAATTAAAAAVGTGAGVAFDSALETPFAGAALQPFDSRAGGPWVGPGSGLTGGCQPQPAGPGCSWEVSGCSSGVLPPAKRLRTSSSAGSLPELLTQQQHQQQQQQQQHQHQQQHHQQRQLPFSQDTHALAPTPDAPAPGHAPASLPGTPRSRAVPRLPSGLQGGTSGPVQIEPPTAQVAKALAMAARAAGAAGAAGQGAGGGQGGGAGGGAPLPHGWRSVQHPLMSPQRQQGQQGQQRQQGQQLAVGCPGPSAMQASASVRGSRSLGGVDVQSCIELLRAYAQAKQEQRRSKAAQLVVQGLLGPLPQGRPSCG